MCSTYAEEDCIFINLRNIDESCEGGNVRTVLVRDFAPNDCVDTNIVPGPCSRGANTSGNSRNDAAGDIICLGVYMISHE